MFSLFYFSLFNSGFTLIPLTHHLDVHGEAAAFATLGILQGPADGVGAQRELGLDGHIGGVSLLNAGCRRAGGGLAGIPLQGGQHQLLGIGLGPSQGNLQLGGTELGLEVEAYLGGPSSTDVASLIFLRLRTGIHSHLVNGAGVHGIRTRLEVDHLRGDGGEDQDEGHSQQRAQTQHGGSKVGHGMHAVPLRPATSPILKPAYLRTR